MHQLLVNIFLIGREFQSKEQMKLALADFYIDCGYSDVSDIPNKVDAFVEANKEEVFSINF